MRVLHVTPTFWPATYWGGPIVSVYGLCNALAAVPKINLRVLTADAAGPWRSQRVDVDNFPSRYPAGYEVYFTRRLACGAIAPGLLARLWGMIRWADVVHLTATYSFPTIPTLAICHLLNKPLVWSPRGGLQAAHQWQGASKPVLKKIWEWACSAVMPRRCVLHVTSDAEKAASRARLPKVELAIIPNGVDVPDDLPLRGWLPGGIMRALYLGRLDPSKGIENLLDALSLIDDEAVRLDVYGTGEPGYSRTLVRRASDMGLGDRVRFHGHVEAEEKTRAFLAADLCVAPSHSENFGMVVVEALAHGIPVIASRGTPWEGLAEHQCGRWVENDPASLANAITYMRAHDLEAMGRNGRAWMEREFSWQEIAERMLILYESVIRR